VAVDFGCDEPSEGFELWAKARGPEAMKSEASTTPQNFGERIFILSAKRFPKVRFA
jgi:hypothetical protein